MKWMAFTDALYSEPATVQYPMLRNCLQHVFRTRWGKPARRRKERRNEPLIEANQEYGDCPHLSEPGLREISCRRDLQVTV